MAAFLKVKLKNGVMGGRLKLQMMLKKKKNTNEQSERGLNLFFIKKFFDHTAPRTIFYDFVKEINPAF